MAVPKPQALLDELRARITDPEKQALLAEIVADTMAVGALALSGASRADRDLLHVSAQAKGLTAQEASYAAMAIQEWFFAFSRALVAGLVR